MSWVRNNYCEDIEWGFLEGLEEDQAVVEKLPSFRILVDDGDSTRGIAAVKREDEDEDAHEDEDEGRRQGGGLRGG